MNARATLAILLGAAACSLLSCAYTVRTRSLPAHLKTIAIPVFENSTTEYRLEEELTTAVIDRFVRDNQLRVVDQRTANAVLRGRVVSYRNAVFGFSDEARAQEYRVTITIAVSFKDQIKNRELWSDDNLAKTANYYVQDVAGQTARTEIDGRREAVQKMADEILSRTVEGW